MPSIIPFGPQHPVLPEPIHLDLVLEDEKVLNAIPRIGYVHRGLELLVKKKDFKKYTFVAERICGICSFMHGMGYCCAIEDIMGLEIPERAQWLRTLWAELSRMHSHMLWLGLWADAFGFEALFMHSWRLREKILDIFEETTGGRVIFSVCDIGGVHKDIDSDTLKNIKVKITEIQTEAKEFAKVFNKDTTVKIRTVDVGVLTKEQAYDLGAVGPMARASGVEQDLRTTGYAMYSKLNSFEPVVYTAGDCYARTAVRIKEFMQSGEMIKEVCDKIKGDEIAGEVNGEIIGNKANGGEVNAKISDKTNGGEVNAKISDKTNGNAIKLKLKASEKPNGESFIRLEQPRGEVLYYVKGNGTDFLDRVRVRTPTFANIPAMLETLKNSNLADVPLLILTIDPCISCTER